jgi:hypothetical protein
MAPPKKKYSELSDSAKYFRDNPKARKKKDAISKEVNARPEQRKKRSELTTKNRQADKKGVDRDGKDYDHAVGKYVKSKTNRGRAGEGGRKKAKKG